MRGQQIAQGHQGVELKKPVHRPAPELSKGLTEGRGDAEPYKQEKEENLADSPDGCNSHF